MKYLKTYEENKNKEEDFDRTEYYLNYIKNLVPKDFKVKKKDDDIIISTK